VGWVVSFLVVAAGFAAVAGGLAWLAARVRLRGIGGAVLNPVDEIFHPAGHQSHAEIQVRDQRAIPMPSPEDH
jgi:hypothetical protein